MAHQGASVEEIAQQVDLNLGEIEFIAKVNKNQLQFSEEDLPEWVRSESDHIGQTETLNLSKLHSPAVAVTPSIAPQPLTKTEDRMTLSDLGDRFRQAISGQRFQASPPPSCGAGTNSKLSGCEARASFLLQRKKLFDGGAKLKRGNDSSSKSGLPPCGPELESFLKCHKNIMA